MFGPHRTMTTLQSLTCAVLTDTGGVLQSSWKVRAGPTAWSTQSSTGNTPSPSPTGETEAGGARSHVHLMPRSDPSPPSAGPSKERQLCDTLKPKQMLEEAGLCRSHSLPVLCCPSLCSPRQGGELAIQTPCPAHPMWLEKSSLPQAMLTSQDQGTGLSIY